MPLLGATAETTLIVPRYHLSIAVIIRLEDRLRPNIGFTLRGNLAVFTVHVVGYNSAKSKPI